MKLGITLIIWTIVMTMLSSTCFGITIITWSDVEILIKAGWWLGLWFVLGGLPLYFGIKRLISMRASR